MPNENLLVAISDRIATITFNRPERLNALDRATIDELDATLDDLLASDDVGGILLTGAGRAFVAGADISELAALGSAGALELSQRGQKVFARLEQGGKPTVAAVNGFALGGGCEVAMACHIRIASDTARFGQPEAKLGLVPGYGGTVRLPRLVGRAMATHLLLTGELIDAAEALRIGLVSRVVPAAMVIEVATGVLKAILANAPLAVNGLLELMAPDESVEYAHEYALFGELAGSDDAKEGTAAFLAKRPAAFTGH